MSGGEVQGGADKGSSPILRMYSFFLLLLILTWRYFFN